MSDLYEKCVVLKNLPHDCDEHTVREVLDLAHGDFCFLDKYKKLHRHVKLSNDIRWIVLFRSKEDALDCIQRGTFECIVPRGTCHVTPDYCSGCIIPDEWTEDILEDDWGIGDSLRSDRSEDTSEKIRYSFEMQFETPGDIVESRSSTNVDIYASSDEVLEHSDGRQNQFLTNKKDDSKIKKTISLNTTANTLQMKRNSEKAIRASVRSADLFGLKKSESIASECNKKPCKSNETRAKDKSNDSRDNTVLETDLIANNTIKDTGSQEETPAYDHGGLFFNQRMPYPYQNPPTAPDMNYSTNMPMVLPEQRPKTNTPQGVTHFWIHTNKMYQMPFACQTSPVELAEKEQPFHPYMFHPGVMPHMPPYSMQRDDKGHPLHPYMMPHMPPYTIQNDEKGNPLQPHMPGMMMPIYYMPYAPGLPSFPQVANQLKGSKNLTNEPLSQDDSAKDNSKPEKGDNPQDKKKTEYIFQSTLHATKVEEGYFNDITSDAENIAANKNTERLATPDKRSRQSYKDLKNYNPSAIHSQGRKNASEVIRRAGSGEKFTLCKANPTVSEYPPPPTDPLKVFIKGIAETTTNECTTFFLAANIGTFPSSVIAGETPGTAMASFETPPDIAKLRKMCERRRCEGKFWSIFEVELVRSIKVKGINLQTSTLDTVTLYFENTKRSCGGEVEEVKYRENYEDFIVTFVKTADALNVTQARHTLGGLILTVSLFYPCLELDEDLIVKIPAALQLDELDDYIIKFILNSERFKRELETKVRDNYGTIEWPSSTDKNNIQILCTVDAKDTKGQTKVKDWAEKCRTAVKEITDSLSVDESKHVAVEVWSELRTRLRELDVPNPEAIAVFIESGNCVVVMVGVTKDVQTMSSQLNNIIKEIKIKFDNENQTITKERKLKTFEMALFRAASLEASLKKKPVELVVDNEQRKIICKGKQKEVDGSLAWLDSKLKSFVKKPVKEMSKQAIDLLFKNEASDIVKKRMIEKKVIGVWEVRRVAGLVMYSKNERDLDTAIEVLKSSIIMDSIELDNEKSDILDGREGKAKIAEFEQKHAGCVIFTTLPNELCFVCTDEIHKDIQEEFIKLFDLHSVVSKTIPTDDGVFNFIATFKRREIDALENQYKRLAVEIKESHRRPGFIVKGNKDGCKLAITKLQGIIDSVVQKDHTVSWPGFDKFLQSSEGRDTMKSIELNEKCVIKVSSGVLSSGIVPVLNFWEKKPEAAAASKETIYIYAGSPYSLDTVVRKVNEIRKEIDFFVPRQVLEHMDEPIKSDLRRIGYSFGVKVVVERSRVKVLGYGKSAETAYRKAQDYVKAVETDIRKRHSACSVKLPSSWSKMKLTDPTKIELLKPGDVDYVNVSGKFVQETGFAATSIVKIERIQNPTLYTQYLGKKKQMDIMNSGGRKVEQMLWHGTKSTAVFNIKYKGFYRNYNSGASHGVGVYFAKQAAMTARGYCSPDVNGHKQIFLAHVLTGEYVVATGPIRVPPLNPTRPNSTYDSTTDNVQAPNFFVIFHDAQAYPSFLITFR